MSPALCRPSNASFLDPALENEALDVRPIRPAPQNSLLSQRGRLPDKLFSVDVNFTSDAWIQQPSCALLSLEAPSFSTDDQFEATMHRIVITLAGLIGAAAVFATPAAAYEIDPLTGQPVQSGYGQQPYYGGGQQPYAGERRASCRR